MILDYKGFEMVLEAIRLDVGIDINVFDSNDRRLNSDSEIEKYMKI